MRLKLKAYSFLTIVVLSVCSWGFHAHKTIHKQAIHTLPIEMVPFFRLHAQEIEDKSVLADKRRYTDTTEACKHYIDIDLYGVNPFDSVPKTWFRAKTKYTEDTLKSRGILPWVINWEYKKLVWAMDSGSIEQVIKHASDIGHYISDACVPLHTTYNYNGQFTNQKGIHALWESRIPESFSFNYDFYTGKAKYIEKPLDYAWNIISESNLLLGATLDLEKEITQKYLHNTKFKMASTNGKIHTQYTNEFISDYNSALNGMVERRLQQSILSVGSFWYSAWIDAGQPSLELLRSHTDTAYIKLKPKHTPHRIHE
tara:strand:+ start:757 stop:1695 length:939 start_codon:yes stop_codon:yes gene_type:complete